MRAYQPRLDFHRLIATELADESMTDDSEDWADAQRGLLGMIDHGDIRNADGKPVWSLRGYGFLDDAKAADTVNPSLWRQARLNRIHGLFKVTERIYQVRGYDLANITFIEGDTGLRPVCGQFPRGRCGTTAGLTRQAFAGFH